MAAKQELCGIDNLAMCQNVSGQPKLGYKFTSVPYIITPQHIQFQWPLDDDRIPSMVQCSHSLRASYFGFGSPESRSHGRSGGLP